MVPLFITHIQDKQLWFYNNSEASVYNSLYNESLTKLSTSTSFIILKESDGDDCNPNALSVSGTGSSQLYFLNTIFESNRWSYSLVDTYCADAYFSIAQMSDFEMSLLTANYSAVRFYNSKYMILIVLHGNIMDVYFAV